VSKNTNSLKQIEAEAERQGYAIDLAAGRTRSMGQDQISMVEVKPTDAIEAVALPACADQAREPPKQDLYFISGYSVEHLQAFLKIAAKAGARFVRMEAATDKALKLSCEVETIEMVTPERRLEINFWLAPRVDIEKKEGQRATPKFEEIKQEEEVKSSV
jgi:hypothetical protein